MASQSEVSLVQKVDWALISSNDSVIGSPDADFWLYKHIFWPGTKCPCSFLPDLEGPILASRHRRPPSSNSFQPSRWTLFTCGSRASPRGRKASETPDILPRSSRCVLLESLVRQQGRDLLAQLTYLILCRSRISV